MCFASLFQNNFVEPHQAGRLLDQLLQVRKGWLSRRVLRRIRHCHGWPAFLLAQPSIQIELDLRLNQTDYTPTCDAAKSATWAHSADDHWASVRSYCICRFSWYA
jgi:hypothetical protein